MASDKSLAAEIEAVLNADNVDMPRGCLVTVDASAVSLKIAARIAALQSRAFEDGARWMRERAHAVAEASAPDCDGEIYIARKIADEIQSLLLQPEGERNA